VSFLPRDLPDLSTHRSRKERNGDDTKTVHRSPGAPGPNGPPRGRPPTYLQGGVGGNHGSSQVTVIRNNGT
jgi:hypothetical protein